MLNHGYAVVQAHLREFARKIARSDDGASMVEYALLVGLIAIVLIGTIGLLSGNIEALFDRAGAELDQIPNATPSP